MRVSLVSIRTPQRRAPSACATPSEVFTTSFWKSTRLVRFTWPSAVPFAVRCPMASLERLMNSSNLSVATVVSPP